MIDCVGSASSIADCPRRDRAPGGALVLAGMPAPAPIDLTPLWQREVSPGRLVHLRPRTCHGWAPQFRPSIRTGRRRFGLERLLSATYPLDRAAEAIEHAAAAGRRGSVKVAFDMRARKEEIVELEGKIR